MSNLGALVVHGLFEHEGRHKDNVEWLKNLGIETYSLNLPGHGDIKEKGHIETWNENIEENRIFARFLTIFSNSANVI